MHPLAAAERLRWPGLQHHEALPHRLSSTSPSKKPSRGQEWTPPQTSRLNRPAFPSSSASNNQLDQLAHPPAPLYSGYWFAATIRSSRLAAREFWSTSERRRARGQKGPNSVRDEISRRTRRLSRFWRLEESTAPWTTTATRSVPPPLRLPRSIKHGEGIWRRRRSRPIPQKVTHLTGGSGRGAI
jgi:hypothetical protein